MPSRYRSFLTAPKKKHDEGMNPVACKEAIEQAAREAHLEPIVAAVSGYLEDPSRKRHSPIHPFSSTLTGMI